MRILNIFIILLIIAMSAAPVLGQSYINNAGMASGHDGMSECHCAMGEHLRSDHPYMTGCDTADKLTQKFHNQYKNIVIAKQILFNTDLAVITYPVTDNLVSGYILPVELPPPRLTV